MRQLAKTVPVRRESSSAPWCLAWIALLAAGILNPPPAAADLVITSHYIGGTPPTNMVGGGNLRQIFKSAADIWQNAFKDPVDTWKVHVDYGWAPIGNNSAQFFVKPEDQGGTPHRIFKGKILFNNSGFTPFFADPTPLQNTEYGTYTNYSETYQGQELNTGRNWISPNSKAAGRYDLFSIATHELGHALGLCSSNTASPRNGPLPITCPRPFAGYTPFVELGDHFCCPPSVMQQNVAAGVRCLVSGLDVLAVAEISQFAHPNLDPYVNPAPRPDLARVFVANKIITMDPARPTATAVGVDRGQIVAVGSLSEVTAAMQGRTFVVDYTFACQVIVPGFVEAHSHFQGYGLYSRVPYLGYYDRLGPDGVLQPGVTNFANVITRLQDAVRNQVARTHNPNLPVLAFGLDPIFFPNEIPGKHLTASMLDQVSRQTPIFLPLLNGHTAVCNTRMLRLVEKEPDWPKIKDTKGVLRYASGEPTGEFDEIQAEVVAFAAFQRTNSLFFPSRALPALQDAAVLTQRGGVTTVTDLAFGATPKASEQIARAFYVLATANPKFPVRVVLGYFAEQLLSNWGTNAVAHLQNVRRTDSNKLRTGPVKVISDGSIQGYTAQLQSPGYLDPQSGNPIWNVDPIWRPDPGQAFYEQCLPFWQAGIQLAVHVNGDGATELILDVLDRLQQHYPQQDHRFSLQHNQLTHPQQFARMAQLGATVNLFCNHLYYYGDQHYEITLGEERAEQMDSPAMAKAFGVPFSLHSDAPVTPMQPLTAMWCAVNRLTAKGRVLDSPGASQKISVQDALQAVTLGGAYLLKLEHEIGSIEPGKRADFTVLGQDPYAVPPLAIANIPVQATIFNGTVFPIK